MKILVTGGAGFIGSALCRYLLQQHDISVINLDALTYAANLQTLTSIEQDPRYQFIQANICDAKAVQHILQQHQPDAIMHLAAESHVDRSLSGPAEFMQTNIMGSYTLLEASRHYWLQLSPAKQARFRFLQVSTDEVFGDLTDSGMQLNKKLFTENHAYTPSSPYSASKASADHLVQAWHRSYGLPTLISYCSNNYGPWQHTEKLMPKAINHLLQGMPVPLYGDGQQVRDWLHVDDHVAALYLILKNGKVGQSYAIGGNNQITNLALVQQLADIIDSYAEQGLCQKLAQPRRDLIEFVRDRPGHDQCYGIDNTKISQQLNWQPQYTLQQGLEKTVLQTITRIK